MSAAKHPQKPTILVVDDEANIRKLVAVNLTSRGYNVLEAESGAQALAFLGKQAPGLMVLDIKLPDLTGWELLNQIMDTPHIKSDFPVLVMTASIMDAHIDLAKFPRVAKILIKPFSMGTFMSTVERILQKDNLEKGDNGPSTRRR